MTIILWILQAILALAFLSAGALKLSRRREVLMKSLPWVADFSTGTVRLIGAVEVLGAIGLILPALTGIVPLLTPIAATGLALVMALGIVVHARRKESSAIAFNAVLLIMAAVIAWGRFGSYAL